MSIRASFDIGRGDFHLDAELEFPSSGITALFGPSGCGKTSLLRAMAGLDEVQGGEMSVNGQVWQDEMKFVPAHQRSVGFVFQEASLFAHLDVRRNINYGLTRIPAGRNRIRIDQVTNMLGIGHLLDRRPDTLSGGERQRVAIARALAVSPDLLLMDEPLASLDAERKAGIMPYLDSLHRELEIPVVYVSHAAEEVARLADHVLLMESGKIVATGSVQEVFTRLDLPLTHDLDAAAVIDAEVVSHDEKFHLTTLGFAEHRVVVPHSGLTPGSSVRIRISARDVSLVLEPRSDTSILNIIPVVVDEIIPEGGAQVTVRLLAGEIPLLARITQKSRFRLELEPGRRAYAQVKSIALLNQ